jgi:hypothetical protein
MVAGGSVVEGLLHLSCAPARGRSTLGLAAVRVRCEVKRNELREAGGFVGLTELVAMEDWRVSIARREVAEVFRGQRSRPCEAKQLSRERGSCR